VDDSGTIYHFDSAQVVAGQTPFSGEHPVAAAKCKTGKTNRSARSRWQETPFRKEELVHFLQSTTRACGENTGLRIELHLAHWRNTHHQSVVVQRKSLKGMASRFYRDWPILCLCSFDGASNANLRYARSDEFWLSYDPGVINLPGGREIG